MSHANKTRYSSADTSSVTYIAAAGHEWSSDGDTGGGVWAGAGAAAAGGGGEVCLLCLSSGVLGVCIVEEALLGRGCSVCLVCKDKFELFKIGANCAAQHDGKHTITTQVLLLSSQIYNHLRQSRTLEGVVKAKPVIFSCSFDVKLLLGSKGWQLKWNSSTPRCDDNEEVQLSVSQLHRQLYAWYVTGGWSSSETPLSWCM